MATARDTKETRAHTVVVVTLDLRALVVVAVVVLVVVVEAVVVRTITSTRCSLWWRAVASANFTESTSCR